MTTVRPHNGRMRGHHSMKSAVSVGLLIAAVATIIFVMSGAANSQGFRCAPVDQVKANALKNYGEKPIGGGLITGDIVVDVLSSPDGATFTILAVHKNGIACYLASGFGWEPGVNPPKSGRPS